MAQGDEHCERTAGRCLSVFACIWYRRTATGTRGSAKRSMRKLCKLRGLLHKENAMTQTTDSTPSGLVKEDLVVGKGASASSGNDVVVHYVGWLQNGAQFDSSRARRDPLDFALGAGDVIKGWDQGIEGMKVGGKRKLTIPAALAYGDQGCGGVIPPQATLVFEVELLEVS